LESSRAEASQPDAESSPATRTTPRFCSHQAARQTIYGMESFFRLLEKRVDDCDSLLCVGLDPHVSDLAAPTASAALDFSLRLIAETAPYTAAFKPNVAFFEQFGAEGWTVLEQVITEIANASKNLGSEIPVVLDAKRGDISTTADAYARSAFEHLKAHSITLSPYLGRDSVEPFIGESKN
jgi:uridine monophosphate synthetase